MKHCLRVFMVVFLALPIAGLGGCDCGGGPSLTGSAPRIFDFFAGTSDQAPPREQYTALPESNEIEVDFGLVDTDTIANRYLFLRNDGQADLKLVGVEWASGGPGELLLACLVNGQYVGGCPCNVEAPVSTPGLSDLVLRLSYAPNNVGPDQDSVTLVTDAVRPVGGRITLRLRGEGVTPEIEVCVSDCTGDQNGPGCTGAPEVCNNPGGDPLPIEYGDSDLSAPLWRNLAIRNKGDRPLTISAINFQGGAFNQFQLDKNNNPLPGMLAAGAEAVVRVAYAPGMGGEHSSELHVVSNDVNEREIRVALHGRALAPRLCPEPLLLDFGNVPSGTAKTLPLALSNCGLMALELFEPRLGAGSSSDFSLGNRPAFPAVLQPEQSVVVEVQYRPMASGSDSGTVELYSDDPTSDPVSHLTGAISLLGQSIPRACEIQVTPFAANFGSVVMNQAEEVNLIVSNQGTDSCTLDTVSISRNSADNEFSVLEKPADGTTFQPGDTLLVRVRYQPVNLGVDTGVLSLFGNDKDGNEVRVDLNGEGVQAAVCDLQVVPTSVRFGTVKVNQSQSMRITLTNVGQDICQISAIDLRKPAMGNSDFTITRAPPLPLTLNKKNQPNSQAEIEVTFAPRSLEWHSAAVVVNSNDPDLQLNAAHLSCAFYMIQLGQACVPLSGYSAESPIEVVPAELDFGVVTVGCNSPEQHVTVYNLGSSAINITDIYLENNPDPNFEIRSAPRLPHSLAGGGSFQVVLRYHPQDTNAHRSTLYIKSDASNVDLLAVPLFGRGTLISDQTDVFHQPAQVRSDVLFVVDNSGSMGDDQQALADNFSSFINWAITLNVDFHIGVVSTEVEHMDTSDVNPAMKIYPGVLVNIPNQTPKIITNQTPNLQQTFSKNVNIGTCCSDSRESGLEGAWLALSEPLVSDPTANGGFLREDAKLYIICVSDEQDQSRGTTDFYVDFFRSIKGERNTDMMKLSAVVYDRDVGSRYVDVAQRTGGIVALLSDNWAQTLQALGIDAFAAIREFPLSRPADPATITVTVDGASVPKASSPDGPDGWSYESDNNSIFFGDNVIPGRGARIEVHYTAQCL